MASKNKKRKRDSRPRRGSKADWTSVNPIRGDSSESRWRLPLLAGLTALLCAQVIAPNDAGAGQGDGVVLVMLWLLLACAWCVGELRSERFAMRWGWIDTIVLALIAWHTVSAIFAIVHGSPRPAINMLWEWVALGIGFLLARQLVRRQSKPERWSL